MVDGSELQGVGERESTGRGGVQTLGGRERKGGGGVTEFRREREEGKEGSGFRVLRFRV